MNYSFSQSLIKTLIRLAIAIIPMAMTLLPEAWMNLTLGGILMLGFDWLKGKYTTY